MMKAFSRARRLRTVSTQQHKKHPRKGTTATSDILYGERAVGARVGTTVGVGVGPVDTTTEAVVADAFVKPAFTSEAVTAPAARAAVSWLVSEAAVVAPPPG